MTGHELRERIHHGNDGLFEVLVLHAGSAPKRPRARHIASGG